MTYYSTFQKRGLKMAILGVVCVIFLFFSYFQPVQADNNYITDISFYKDENTHYATLRFFVNTTFTIYSNSGY